MIHRFKCANDCRNEKKTVKDDEKSLDSEKSMKKHM